MEIPDGSPDNTVRIAMSIPTQIRNQPLVSHTFLTFQIDTRQSLAASTSGKLAATIRKLRLDELIGGRRGVPFKKQRRIDHLRLQVCLVVFSRPASTIIAHPSDARGRLHVSRPLHAQLSRPFNPSSVASCHTPQKHCGSPEHEQHLLSRRTHSP